MVMTTTEIKNDNDMYLTFEYQRKTKKIQKTMPLTEGREMEDIIQRLNHPLTLIIIHDSNNDSVQSI